LTGTAKGTVLRLLAEIGDACYRLHDRTVRNIKARKIQCDEIWSFCHAKARNVPARLEGKPGVGDLWTWVALDADTKLAISWLVGQRDTGEGTVFMRDLVSRLANRVQLTTDGFPGYLRAVEEAFGWNGVDYAMVGEAVRPWLRDRPGLQSARLHGGGQDVGDGQGQGL